MATAAAEPPVRRDLFGGAVTMALPARFEDISQFREVPDHQEVSCSALAGRGSL